MSTIPMSGGWARLEPKPFQTEALDALERFLSGVRLRGTEGAFIHETSCPYRPLPGMEAVPAVTIKIPTGGGKTMVAALAVGAMAKVYSEPDVPLPLVLWLVPSDTIRTQTLRALTNPDHPYRQALRESFGESVAVMEMANFAQLRPQMLRTHAVILVGTMQSLQVEKKEGRKVYDDHEDLLPFFSTEAIRSRADLDLDPASATGAPKSSFANLLKVYRPFVIVDEEHRFMTPLAEKVRRRIGARVVLGLTATPDANANILYTAKPSQLKAAQMIKLPVMLTEHRAGWQQAVSAAVRQRRYLAEKAADEPEYVRPILLIQAEAANGVANWQAVRAYLIEEGLSAEEVKVETGEVRELAGIDLFSPACPVTAILTVKALEEGWDCSFAYVLCSVSNTGAATAVEQVLGRVLRMPYARERKHPELNAAYAHVSSVRFGDALRNLEAGLVKNGWSENDAKAALRLQAPELPLLDGVSPDVLETRLVLQLPREPDLTAVPVAEQERMDSRPMGMGMVEVTIAGPVSESVQEAVLAAVPAEHRAEAESKIAAHNELFETSPAEKGVIFRVPLLTVEREGERLPFDSDKLDEIAEFNLAHRPADVSALEFHASTRSWSIDLYGERFTPAVMQEQNVQQLLLKVEVTDVELAAWLQRRLRENWFRHGELAAWLLKGIASLLERPGVTLGLLHQSRNLLLDKFMEQIKLLKLEQRGVAYERVLFSVDESTALTSREFTMELPASYALAADQVYQGRRFQKHLHRQVAKMNEAEVRCAEELDRMEQVEFWVRNLEKRPRESFWLQTKTDKFYPDFVARLRDGSWLAVEYKGADRVTNDDSGEKEKLGRLWAERSGGVAHFVMVWEAAGRLSLEQQLRRAVPVGL